MNNEGVMREGINEAPPTQMNNKINEGWKEGRNELMNKKMSE